ncbi:MAG: hypothetical protein JW950_01155, partial [Deltaproteobacteria bacterium]|nr:hypothetical protein [Deltaproteobacteria bacterium]
IMSKHLYCQGENRIQLAKGSYKKRKNMLLRKKSLTASCFPAAGQQDQRERASQGMLRGRKTSDSCLEMTISLNPCKGHNDAKHVR